jgi:hypothetical protein
LLNTEDSRNIKEECVTHELRRSVCGIDGGCWAFAPREEYSYIKDAIVKKCYEELWDLGEIMKQDTEAIT